MVKYFYNKYHATSARVYSNPREVSGRPTKRDYSNVNAPGVFSRADVESAFSSSTGFSYGKTNLSARVGSVLYEGSGTALYKNTIVAYDAKGWLHPDGVTYYPRWDYDSVQIMTCDVRDEYTRGALVTSNIIAENGAYPANGRHTDGYWYVRGNVANAVPTLTLATTDNRTLYENDTFAVSGQVTDTDVGNVVTVKYSIDGGAERAITANISQGTAQPYNRVLTFKQGKLFDGTTAITDTLADGAQHVLKVWAEDDKGGKSVEIIRAFYVVSNRSAVLTINPVAATSDLIDSDRITISGNVSDPDGNTVKVRYKVGNGAYIEVYSGVSSNFTFNVPLASLQTGVNTVSVQATDSYGLTTTKTLRVTKTANNRPLLKSVATYKLLPPNGAADGIVLWVQRETGDLVVNAEISMGAAGAAENFVPMVKESTAYVTDTIEEDEFTFDNGEVAAENIIVRLTMTRTSASSNVTIKLISGVLS